MASADDRHIAITSVGSTSEPFLIGNAVRLSVSITMAGSFKWGNAIVEVEYTLDDEQARWHSFSTAKQFSATVLTMERIPVAGLVAVRLRTTTPNGTGDPQAIYDWTLF